MNRQPAFRPRPANRSTDLAFAAAMMRRAFFADVRAGIRDGCREWCAENPPWTGALRLTRDDCDTIRDAIDRAYLERIGA